MKTTLASLAALCLYTTTAADFVQLAVDAQSPRHVQSFTLPAGKVAAVIGCSWTGNGDLSARLEDMPNAFQIDTGGAVLGPAQIVALARTGTLLAVLRVDDASPTRASTVELTVEGSDDLVSWHALTTIEVPAGTGPLNFYRVSLAE